MKKSRGSKYKGYSLRRHPTNGNYSVSVPIDVGNLVPPDARFLFEIVEEGILMRRIIPKPVPEWIRNMWSETANDSPEGAVHKSSEVTP